MTDSSIPDGFAYIHELSDENLVDVGAIAKDDAVKHRRLQAACEGLILQRQSEEEATLTLGQVYQADRKMTRSYSWDIGAVWTALVDAGFSPKDYIETTEIPATTTQKVGTVKLLALAKKLGRKGEAIMAAHTTSEEPSVKFAKRDGNPGGDR